MVEISDPVSQLDRVVIGEKMAERAELDSLGALQRLGDQQVGSRARLPRRREVLADPRLLEAKRVEPLEFFEIPGMAISDGPFGRVRRHEESAQPHRTPSSLVRGDLAAPLPYTKSESAKV